MDAQVGGFSEPMINPVIEPHPEFQGLTAAEIRAAIAETEAKLTLARANGCSAEIVTWIEQELCFGEAALARRNGHSPHSRSTTKFPVIDETAFHGLAGDIVAAITPYSEADSVAILVNILASFGNCVGSGPHFAVEKSHHHLNLFIVQVGRSSKARKGLAWSTPKHMFRTVDPAWVDLRLKTGMSSGEGLIFAVRDQRIEKKAYKKNGKTAGYEDVMVDAGETDKRLLCVEEEFAQALKVINREGNILSPVLRDAWDGNRLATMTKNNPVMATAAHVSIIGHITRDELLRYFTTTEQTNGFGNRFIWLVVKRSKEIPTPTGCPDEILQPLIERLSASVVFSRQVGLMTRDTEAEALWRAVYHDLSEEKSGLAGAILGRAEPQVMRVACIYSCLDHSSVVTSSHLEAALAFWDYAEQSSRFIFGDLKGDPALDRAIDALKQAGRMTVTDIHNLFGRHADSSEVDRVVRLLLNMPGVTESRDANTGGRPRSYLIWSEAQTN